jgi:hypothetical protein
MSKRTWTLVMLLAALGVTSAALAHERNRDVSVEIIGANGASFEQFPVNDRGTAYRAYLKAERNAPYRIRIRNLTDRRVAVAVAVDGRNIISGTRSDLARGEPMYILGPWETQDYTGWRTSMTDVHEFFFTEWANSYAEAFGDRSARGVIAVAAYREKERPQPKLSVQPYSKEERAAGAAAQAAPAPANEGKLSRSDAQTKDQRDSEPGTGFGEQRYEPVTRIEFESERSASARVFLKYEWQETLCKKRVIDCGEEKNRFWNDDLAFAPFPPPRNR